MIVLVSNEVAPTYYDEETTMPSKTTTTCSSPEPKRRGRGVPYPWHAWFDLARPPSRGIRLVRGKHFTARAYAMAQQLRNAAYTGKGGYTGPVSVTVSQDEQEVTMSIPQE
jgi:hypothetical protein